MAKNPKPASGPALSPALQGVPGVDPEARLSSSTTNVVTDAATVIAEPPSTAVKADPKREDPRTLEVIIECPLKRMNSYAPRALHGLNGVDARTLRDVADALQARGQKLGNGRAVSTSNDALVWLLETLRNAAGDSLPPIR